MFQFDSQIFYNRRQEFLSKLDGKAAIIPSANLVQHHADCEYPFRQNSNFWYLTGFDEPDSVALLLSQKDEGEKFILFVNPKDRTSEVWQGFRWGLDGAQEVFKADKCHPISELKSLLPYYLKGAEELVFSIGKQKSIDSLVLEIWAKQLENLSRTGSAPIAIKSPEFFLNEMRLIKSEYEIGRIREAAQISADAHEFVRANASTKNNERQLQGLVEGFFLDNGARGPAYNTIVASGDNACVLHYTSNNSQLKDGDLILIDAGCSLMDYYNGDITRTFPISGKFSGEQKAIYEIVLEAQKSAIANVITGVDSNHIHNSALKVLVDGLKELGLLKGDTEGIIEEGSYKHLYMHKTGHWLGLDVHDVGAYRLGDYEVPLKNGMILTVEPGIYISDRIPVSKGQPEINSKWKGIGVRIEDDILVNNQNPEVLTKAALKEISELES